MISRPISASVTVRSTSMGVMQRIIPNNHRSPNSFFVRMTSGTSTDPGAQGAAQGVSPTNHEMDLADTVPWLM